MSPLSSARCFQKPGLSCRCKRFLFYRVCLCSRCSSSALSLPQDQALLCTSWLIVNWCELYKYFWVSILRLHILVMTLRSTFLLPWQARTCSGLPVPSGGRSNPCLQVYFHAVPGTMYLAAEPSSAPRSSSHPSIPWELSAYSGYLLFTSGQVRDQLRIK